METTKNVLEYIDTQLAKIETEAIEIEVEKLKIGYLKQRNNVERLQIDREKLALKIKEIVKIKKSLLIFCELGNFCVIKFLINNTEDDFCIIDLNCMEIWQAISTSMDRLLLETTY